MDTYKNTGMKPRKGQSLTRPKPLIGKPHNNNSKPITNHQSSQRAINIHHDGSNTYLRKDQHRK